MPDTVSVGDRWKKHPAIQLHEILSSFSQNDEVSKCVILDDQLYSNPEDQMIKKRYLLQVAALILPLFLFAGVKVTYSYILQKRDQDMIRIAYMNGAIEALKLDIERIKKIKSNDALFKLAVITAANNYIKKVEVLNETKYAGVTGSSTNHPAVNRPSPTKYKIVYVPVEE